MAPLLPAIAVVLSLLVPSFSPADPDRQRKDAEATFARWARSSGAEHRRNAKLTYPTRTRQWRPILDTSTCTVRHKSTDGGDFKLQVRLKSGRERVSRVATIIRFHEEVPTRSLPLDQRKIAHRMWRVIRRGESTYFLRPRAQITRGYIPKSSLTAELATWGPTWLLHGGVYEVEFLLLP